MPIVTQIEELAHSHDVLLLDILLCLEFCVLPWKTKKQSTVSHPFAKAEYCLMATVMCELIGLNAF